MKNLILVLKSFLVSSIVFIGMQNAVFAYNTCANAQALSPYAGDQSVTVSTIGANDNVSSGAIACMTSLGSGGQHWFTYFTENCSPTQVVVSTQYGITEFDTKLHVYSGTCNNFVCVAGDDDSGDGSDSYLVFTAYPNTMYYIRLGGFNADQGNATLTLSPTLEGCLDPEASNYDPCASIADGSCCYGMSGTFSISDNVANELESYAYARVNEQIVAFFYVGETVEICFPTSCSITITFLIGNPNLNWENTYYSMNIQGQSFSGPIPEPVVFGESWVVINLENCGCTDPLAGNYDPDNTIDAGGCVYMNDNADCSNAIPVQMDELYYVNTYFGNLSVGSANGCMSGINMRDLWYSFVYEGGGLSIDLIKPDYPAGDPSLELLDGCGGNLLACNDDYPLFAGINSRLNVDCSQGLVKGETYYIRTSTYGYENMGEMRLYIHRLDFHGCTDPGALNFNPCASMDDETCLYEQPQSCEGDLDHNGSINVNDLLIFLTLYNTTCNP